jgi:hypothetical protein
VPGVEVRSVLRRLVEHLGMNAETLPEWAQ